MLKDFLQSKIKSQASYPEVGYGQVEPNHLSAQYNGKIYAQLPANKDIKMLEQGQFVKYDYENGEVNFTGDGEWMLVFNEIKLYREFQRDCEFAMIKGNYSARVYSPVDEGTTNDTYGPTRFWQGNNPNAIGIKKEVKDGKVVVTPGTGDGFTAPDYKVASDVHDYWEMDDINSTDPAQVLFMRLRSYREKEMKEGTSMFPRVFKTDVGDLYTTNMINETELTLGDKLYVGDKGILCKTKAEKSVTFAGSGDMIWKVVKVYTVPDHQRGVKLQRIQ